jgi:hypothetical protein
MMKPTLKRSDIRMFFGKLILPEGDPLLDGELQIARRTKPMEMIGHEQIIAHHPRSCLVLPDFVKRALDGRLRQPWLAFLCANGKKNPIRSTEGAAMLAKIADKAVCAPASSGIWM